MATVQIALNNWRRRHPEQADRPGATGSEEDNRPVDSGATSTALPSEEVGLEVADDSPHGGNPGAMQSVPEGGDHPQGETMADGAPGRPSLREGKQKHVRPVIFAKSRLEERLVLEEEMVSQIPRCCLFLAQFFIFLAMLWTAYPASTLLPIYQALMAGVEVDGTSPTNINTIEDLKEYLPGLAAQWKSFSPGSSAYVGDPGARKYISGVTPTPPVINLGSEVLQPKIGSSFTFVAWIRTTVRFDTLMKKVQQERADSICWQFDLERIIYGQHEASEPNYAVHPLADEVWREGADADTVWKTSAIRSNISDGRWHQYAIMVEQKTATFFLDGVSQGQKSLPRPITDCARGTVTIGSDLKRGDIVDVQYIPRLLTAVDLNFLSSMGRLPDEVLSGSGVSETKETDMEMLQRMARDGISNTNSQHISARESLLVTMRQLYKALRSQFLSVSSSVETAALDLSEEHDSLQMETSSRFDEIQYAFVDIFDTLESIEDSVSSSGGGDGPPPNRRLEESARRHLAENARRRRLDGTEATTTTVAQTTQAPTGQTTTVAPGEATSTSAPSDGNGTSEDPEDDKCKDHPSCFRTILRLALRDIAEENSGYADSVAGRLAQCLAENGVGSKFRYDLIASGTLPDMPSPGTRHPLLPDNGACDQVEVQCADSNVYARDWGDELFWAYGDASFGLSCRTHAQAGICGYGYFLGDAEGSESWLDPRTLDACCACGGGTFSAPCYDSEPDFADQDGNGCEYYNANPSECQHDGPGPGPRPDQDPTKVCCACGAGFTDHEARTPFTVDNVDRTFGSVPQWYDDFGHDCDWYLDNNICTEDGQTGSNFVADHQDLNGRSEEQKRTLQEWWDASNPMEAMEHQNEATRGDESAWRSCETCGGGVYQDPQGPSELMLLLKEYYVRSEGSTCNDPTSSQEWRDMCPESCAVCPIKGLPGRDETYTALLSCNDEPYEDWLQQDCSFYALWDAATDGQPACSRYAGDDTRAKCLRTCGTCSYTTIIMDLFDIDRNGKMSVTEFNHMSATLGMSISGVTGWQNDVRYFICNDVDPDSEECWKEDQYPEVDVGVFSGFPDAVASKMVQAKANILLDNIEVPLPFLEFEQETAESALMFSRPAVFSGETSYAVQKEMFEAVFISCANHSVCENLFVTACGDVERANNKLCSRHFEVPMFCATKCHTGGCGSDGSVLPVTDGAYCQPCDACAVEAPGFACPEWCQNYTIDAEGEFAMMEEAEIADADERPDLGKGESNLPGSFTLTAWVKSFDTQWLFDRKIRMPGLSPREGYDPDTGLLTCWQASPFELKFRNRWDEKAMTTVKNPMADRITATIDSWHFVAIRKHSYMTQRAERLEELRWLVDGTLSDVQYDDLTGTALSEIPPMGFPDCGGMIISSIKASSVSYEGPDHFYEDPFFIEWDGTSNLWMTVDEFGVESSTNLKTMTLPLTPGRYGASVFTFSGLGIPAGAIIKGARFNFCPAVPVATHMARGCGIDYSEGTSRIKIAGLKASSKLVEPEMKDADPHFLCKITNQTDKLSREQAVWEIDHYEWHEDGVPQILEMLTMEELGHEVCSRHSPDLTAIVKEMLEWSSDDSITFVLSQEDRAWGECGATRLWETPEEEREFKTELEEVDDPCDQSEARSKMMEERFPLWVIPPGDEDRIGANPPRLIVEYCFNEDCISPSFLGAGESARDTRVVHAAKAAAAEAALEAGGTVTDEEEDADARLRRLQDRAPFSMKPKPKYFAGGHSSDAARSSSPSSKPKPQALGGHFKPEAKYGPTGSKGFMGPKARFGRGPVDWIPKAKIDELRGKDLRQRMANLMAKRNATGLPNRRPSRAELLGSRSTPFPGARGPRRLDEVCASEAAAGSQACTAFKGAGAERAGAPAPPPLWARKMSAQLKEKAKGGAKLSKLARGRNPAMAKKQASPLAKDRRLQVDNMSACTARTCLSVGEVLDSGLATRGMMLDPLFGLRVSATSELQQNYYGGIPFLKPEGQIELTGALEIVDREAAQVLQYPQEVVSIIPPIIFQRRSQLTSCHKFTPGLADSLEAYFQNQNLRRCSEAYTCSQISGFGCVDRDTDVPAEQLHWGMKTLHISGAYMYPEFFEMFSVPTLYRGDMVSTSDWLDIQTADVMLVNIFLAPKQRVGTVMTLKWTISAAKVTGSVDTKSFVLMSPEERDMWSVMNVMVGILASLDLILLFISVIRRFLGRRNTLQELTKYSALSDEQEDRVNDQLGLISVFDLFDIFLRVLNLAFAVWHSSMYPDPSFEQIGGQSTRLEYLEAPLKEILDLQWGDPSVTTQEKVDMFMKLVVGLNVKLMDEDSHRLWAKILVLLFFVRVVIYMRVHPRIAILYSTLIEMYMDFMHFLLLATTLFCVLAFLGTWSFGDKVADFGDFQTSLYTQFRMIVGEFNLPEGEDSGFQFTFGLYAIIYFLMVFSLLLNFFLAIVIDSYANVKDSVKDCKIESSVVWDLGASFLYPILAPFKGWPRRNKLITLLMRADLNQDGLNDENQVEERDIPVTAEILVDFGFCRNIKSAKSFMWYYFNVCPALGVSHKEHMTELEHKKSLRKLEVIDGIWYEVRGELGPKGKVLEAHVEPQVQAEFKETLATHFSMFETNLKQRDAAIKDGFVEELKTIIDTKQDPGSNDVSLAPTGTKAASASLGGGTENQDIVNSVKKLLEEHEAKISSSHHKEESQHSAASVQAALKEQLKMVQLERQQVQEHRQQLEEKERHADEMMKEMREALKSRDAEAKKQNEVLAQLTALLQAGGGRTLAPPAVPVQGEEAEKSLLHGGSSTQSPQPGSTPSGRAGAFTKPKLRG